MKKLKVFEGFENNNTDPKYKVGEKVYYMPKLSGLDNKTPLIVSNFHIETKDVFGNKLEFPVYIYSFEDNNLSAYETDLTRNL